MPLASVEGLPLARTFREGGDNASKGVGAGVELGAESLEADTVLGLRLEVAESVVTKGGVDMVDVPVAGDKVVVLFSVEDVEGSDLVSSVTLGLVPANGEPSAATLQRVGGTRGWG